MVKVLQNQQSLLNQRVARPALDICNETHTARVVFAGTGIQAVLSGMLDRSTQWIGKWA